MFRPHISLANIVYTKQNMPSLQFPLTIIECAVTPRWSVVFTWFQTIRAWMLLLTPLERFAVIVLLW